MGTHWALIGHSLGAHWALIGRSLGTHWTDAGAALPRDDDAIHEEEDPDAVPAFVVLDNDLQRQCASVTG